MSDSFLLLQSYLDDNVRTESTQSILPYVTIEVMVPQAQIKLQVIDDIGHAGVRAVLGINFAIEDLISFDSRHHIGRSAVDRHVVARRQLISRC